MAFTNESIRAIGAVFSSSYGADMSASTESVPSQTPSVFEEMALRNGQLPTPFKAIIETITANQGRPFNVNIKATDISGRSLQAQASTTKFPRNVVLVTTQNSPTLRGGVPEYLFAFGYTPNDGKIEVVSWNRHTRKFDFIEVTGYMPNAAEGPRLNRNVEAICASCHQAKAPILSRFPWLELHNENDRLRNKTDLSREELTPEELDLLKFIRPENVATANSATGDVRLGTRLIGQLSGVQFDSIVRRSNRALQAANMCRQLCAPGAGGLTCRRHTFLISIFGDDMFETPEKSAEWKAAYVALVTPRWPKDEFAYRTSVLPDRDPTNRISKKGSVSVPVIKDLNSFALNDLKNEFCNSQDESIKAKFIWSFDLDPKDISGIFCNQTNGVDQVTITKKAGFTQSALPLTQSKLFPDRLKRAATMVHTETGTTGDFGRNLFGTARDAVDTVTLPFSRSLKANGVAIANPGDPTVLRPQVSHITPEDAPTRLIENGSFGCFGITATEINNLFQSPGEKSEMGRTILKSPAFNQLLNSSWPPSREQIERLFEDVRGGSSRETVNAATSKLLLQSYPSLRIAPTGNVIRPNSAPAMKLDFDMKTVVQQRCATCHGSPDSSRPLPLGGNSSQISFSLSKFVSKTNGHTVVDYLNGNGVAQMPPGNATGLKPEERELLIRTLKASGGN